VARIGPPDYRGWPGRVKGPALAAAIAVTLAGVFVPLGLISPVWLDLLIWTSVVILAGLVTWAIAERRERRRGGG
jgi:hypothetical protein